MARGGKREGAGRKAGAPNKRTAEITAKAEASGLMPLEFMLSVLRDEMETAENRRWAAEKAAPYLHARLANVEMNAKVAVSHEDALGELE
ncbi:hypothetical protein [Mesorhizobium sp. Pch-S]|uniref:hypothetical protein n=1 Tax=Mesorhizobium sp. Pch-S TaxID=2082387 RepID=UPI001FDF6342|nr:hypothetical protein [Mesorhizobium sp. Pch-S]